MNLFHETIYTSNIPGIENNILIKGDNLLGLKALEHQYAGKIKCIYIDPPFNTQSVFTHYDDSMEHSLWLSMIKERLIILHKLLREDGIFFMHLDNSEMAYAKIIMDEIFGRKNHLNTITLTTNAPSGFKATSSTVFSTANYLLIYAKAKQNLSLKKIFIQKGYDSSYSQVLLNGSEHYSKWKYDSIKTVVATQLGFSSARDARKHLGGNFQTAIEEYALKNAHKVFRTAAIGGGAAAKRAGVIASSKNERRKVFVHNNEDIKDFYILNGEQILFYQNRLVRINNQLLPGEIISDVWTDISWSGIASEGGIKFKNGKKPEALIKRLIEMSTEAGDIVLDCFAGSGTTGAVAHKMGRRWIMIEMGEHAKTLIIPRLQKVIQGNDSGGVTKTTNWKGGGGFKFYEIE